MTKPLSSFITNRQESISNKLEKAEKLEAKATRLQEEQEALIKQAHIEAKEIRKNAEQAAVVEKENLINKAKSDAERIVEEARKDMQGEYEAAKESLKRDVLRLSVNIAGKLIEKNVDSSDAESLIKARTAG